VWDTVRIIPKGKVATYGDIATEAGIPGQARMVGYALHALPQRSGVPWHRIINAQGKISFPPGSEAHIRQKRLLRSEGVVFRGDRIDLRQYGVLRSRRR
jgi:methylated-DNA-protein-cysteine methyltransferase-like protein